MSQAARVVISRRTTGPRLAEQIAARVDGGGTVVVHGRGARARRLLGTAARASAAPVWFFRDDQEYILVVNPRPHRDPKHRWGAVAYWPPKSDR